MLQYYGDLSRLC